MFFGSFSRLMLWTFFRMLTVEDRRSGILYTCFWCYIDFISSLTDYILLLLL